MKTIRFGILVREKGGWKAYSVPIDVSGQKHIESMFESTARIIADGKVHDFELAQKYSDEECAKLSLSDPLADQIRDLYDTGKIEPNTDALNDLDKVIAYFGIIDEKGKDRLLGLRQARAFKSLKAKPVWTLSDGQLTVDDRPKFTLSANWEIMTSGQDLMIVSATALERICDLSGPIRVAAEAGLEVIAPQLAFMNMEPLKARVGKYTRSARIVADLQRRGDLAAVTEGALKNQSDFQGIEYEVVDHKYMVKVGSEEKLLMLLDRRRYADPLVSDNPDIYEADSRHKVGKAT